MTGTYQDFLFALGYSESSNRDWYINPYGFAGYFQLGEAPLKVLGYYGPDSTPNKMDMLDGWTAKAKAAGIHNLQDFLANHAFQEKAMTEYFSHLWEDQWGQNFEGSNLKEFVGQTVAGIKITVSGLMAGSHLVGADNVEVFLRSGGATVPADSLETTVAEYLSKFAGYDMSPVTGGWKEPGLTPPAPTPTPTPTPTYDEVFVGTAGRDAFRLDDFKADRILGFNPAMDTILLDDAVFPKLGHSINGRATAIKKAFFEIGNRADDKNDYLIYNSKTGALSYDADGSGSRKAVLFATLSKNLKMSYDDFLVI
jgi:Ca2+-binding RTX toxin-like protein